MQNGHGLQQITPGRRQFDPLESQPGVAIKADRVTGFAIATPQPVGRVHHDQIVMPAQEHPPIGQAPLEQSRLAGLRPAVGRRGHDEVELVVQ